LKISIEEEYTSKGAFRLPFIKPFPPNRPTLTMKGLNFEGLQYALQTILEAHDNSVSSPPKNHDNASEEETPDEEDSSPPIFGICRTTYFKQVLKLSILITLEVKHKTNLHPKHVGNVVSKQPKKTETRQNSFAPVLEYDLVEDLKKLRFNTSFFELLKFPLIL
jgi:hypothetical protein